MQGTMTGTRGRGRSRTAWICNQIYYESGSISGKRQVLDTVVLRQKLTRYEFSKYCTKINNYLVNVVSG